MISSSVLFFHVLLLLSRSADPFCSFPCAHPLRSAALVSSLIQIVLRCLVSMQETVMNSSQFFFEELLDSSSSDDDVDFLMCHVFDNDNEDRKHGGSIMGRKVIDRDREGGHFRLYDDYFSENPTYGPTYFRRRFRMSRPLFLRILEGVQGHEKIGEYFVRSRNAAGKLGLSGLQKVTAVLRILAYGVPADATDEYIRIGESTALESLRKFVKAVVEVFGEQYLRVPNQADVARLMEMNEKRGFPGMLGSIDCMHWAWKNCPTGWQGQFKGHFNKPTIILEAVASQDLWFWHAFFGLPGSHNDINVLQRSPLFARLAEGKAPEVNYNINGHDYRMGYYLADGIYPPWATFVKTIPMPIGNKKKHFAQQQEAARKDVERAFGVLQARFAIVKGPVQYWDQVTLGYIMKACVIMHNMIVEDEQHDAADLNFYGLEEPVEVSHENTLGLNEFILNHQRIKDREVHCQLQNDLVEHLWQRFGE